jgi:hypothetical protein
MKTMLHIGIIMLLIFCAVIVSYSQIPKEQAIRFVMDSIVANKVDSMNVFIEGDLQSNPYYYIGSSDSLHSPFSTYWLFFIDLHPHWGWEHPCKYVLVSAYNGAFLDTIKTIPPQKNLNLLDQVSIAMPNTVVCTPNFSIQNTTVYPAVNHHLYALMFTGGDQMSNLGPNGPGFWNAICLEYNIIREQGFPKENITVLSYDGTVDNYNAPSRNNPSLDLDNDGYSEILQSPCTPDNIHTILSNLAGQLTTDDLLYIFISTHGGHSGSY